jgi:tetratricopeptide (TPR) repeat protein
VGLEATSDELLYALSIAKFKMEDLTDPSELEAIVLSCNKQAMEHLHSEHFEAAHQHLSRAEQLLKRHQHFDNRRRLMAITCNNQGCFFKRVGELELALQYLKEALELEQEGEDEFVNKAGTLLNICAILSQTGKHEEALQNALKALGLLKQRDDNSTNAVTTLVIAYHNTGVELECLSQHQEATLTFKQGWDLAKDCLGLRHPLACTLKKSYMQATEAVIDRLPRHSSSSRGRNYVSSMGSPKSLPRQAKKHKKPVSVPPSATKWNLPSIGRANARKYSSSRNVVDSSFPPWVGSSLSGTEEAADLQRAEPFRVAPPAEIADQLISGNVRFISGVRKQPMHKEPMHSSSKARPLKPSPPKKSPGKTRSKAADSIRNLKTKTSSNSIDIPHKRKVSKGALTSKIDSISEQLNGLQQKLQDFEGKFMKGKGSSKTPDSATDVSSFKDAKRSDASIKSDAVRLLEHTLTFVVLSVAWDGLKISRRRQIKPTKQTPHSNKRSLQESPLASIPESSELVESRLERLLPIQSYIRGSLARLQYSTAHKAAVTIQKIVKKRQTWRLYRNIRNAVIFIQASYRGHRTRMRLSRA